MKKNEIFTFTAPNGVEVAGVVVNKFIVWNSETTAIKSYIAYAQNRLFSFYTVVNDKPKDIQIIAEYAILPEYDILLENYQHQLDMADDYADREY